MKRDLVELICIVAIVFLFFTWVFAEAKEPDHWLHPPTPEWKQYETLG